MRSKVRSLLRAARNFYNRNILNTYIFYMTSPNIFIMSIISTIIFGLIDASFFLIGEETFQKILIDKYNFDLPMAELATGGFASSLAIFVASFISYHIHSKYTIIDSPIIDAIGIILGTLIILLIYIFFLKNKK